MTSRIIRTITFVALALCATLPAWSQQYLYTPQPLPADDKAALQDGIIVQEIVIRKGDTLSRLSRKYSGRGMYYPQILLFNSIKNPDLIYTGRTLRVPVSSKSPVESRFINSLPESTSPTPVLNVPKKKRSTRTKSEPVVAVAETQAVANGVAVTETAGSEIFEAATKAYRRDDCRTALELLDRFLASHSNSPNAAEADLYKAECYLKLSAQ